MSTVYELRLVIPDSMWLTSNGRYHWAQKARATRELRDLAALTARIAGLPRMEKAHITALIQYRTTGRADPANSYPTVKAAIDGLVSDYGLLPGDDHEHLVGPDMRRAPGRAPRGQRVITLRIEDLDTEFPA